MLLFNIIISLLMICVITYVYDAFILRAIRNSRRFRVEELRDRLYFMAMEGKIRRSDRRYSAVIEVLDLSIDTLMDLRLSGLLSFIRSFHANERMQAELRAIRSSEGPDDRDLRDIVDEYYKVMGVILRKELSTFKILGLPLMKGLAPLCRKRHPAFSDSMSEIARLFRESELVTGKQ